MKRLLSLLIAAVSLACAQYYPNAGGPGGTVGYGSGTTDPATCTPNVTLDFFNTTSQSWKYCSASNTWTAGRSVVGNQVVSTTVLATNLPVPVKGTPDGAIFMDGAMTSSSATFTSASTTFSGADCSAVAHPAGGCTGTADKLILVHGAGAAGASLATTIVGYTSAHVVTLATSASTSVTGNGVCPHAGCGAYGTDNSTAISAALAVAVAAGGGTLGFSGGIYLTNAQVLIQNSFIFLHGVTQGSTVLYAGSGAVDAVVKFSPSSPNVNCTPLSTGCLTEGGISNLTIRGSSLSTNALLNLASHHMQYRGVRLADATTCFLSQFAVLNTYDTMICSGNENQGKTTEGFLRQPTDGFVLDAYNTTGQSMSGTWTNTIAERLAGVGIKHLSSGNNTFISGSSEGNDGGILLNGSVNRNVIIGMDFESNASYDVYAQSGSYNAFHTINSAGLTHVGTAGNTIFDGGQFVTVTIDSGAGSTLLNAVNYSGVLTNNSTSTAFVGPSGVNIGALFSIPISAKGLANVGDYGNSVPYQAALFGTNALGADMGSGMLFGGRYSGTSTTAFGGILCKKLNATDGNYSGYCDIYTRTSGSVPAVKFRVDAAGAAAGETSLLLWDVTGATLQRVSIGASDSGGTGYRVLRIPN